MKRHASLRQFLTTLGILLAGSGCAPDREGPTGPSPSLDISSAAVSCDANVGGGVSPFPSIQAAIDAATPGQTICVYPGTYNEAAPGSTLSIGSGTYQFGLFFPAAKPGLTLAGVDGSGSAITDASATMATINTNATNNFGTSGIYVEAANTTIQGVEIGPNATGDNKTIEVVADNFTLQYATTAIPGGGGSVYINDWTPLGDLVKSYHILDNIFADGTSVDIASGAGNTGPVTGREILRNTFDLLDNGFNAISFNGAGGPAWFANPVGGAIIQNNSFANSTQYIRARGVYDNTQFDWSSYWNDNAFDRAAIALVSESPFDVRSWSYTSSPYTFTNVRRIGGTIQGEIQDGAVQHAQVGDVVLVRPGVYNENLTVPRAIVLASTAGRAQTTIVGQPGGSTVNVTSNTSGLVLGRPGEGFTIVGTDGPPGIEQAAVYFTGPHSNARIEDNNIVANGDAALTTEFSALIAGFIITGNEFSGQTFTGTQPAGDGFSQQFTLANVPRQLVVVSGGSGGGNTSNISFIDNLVSGTAGGTNSSGDPQGNNLVTIDAQGALVRGNRFTGFTNRLAHSLRVRGPSAVVTRNQFTAGSPVGVFVGALSAPTSQVVRNAIVGNTAGIVVEGSPTSALDATCNWFGTPTGPTNAGNPGGTGDPVVGNAIFAPWLGVSNLEAACPDDAPPIVSNVAITPNPAPYTTSSLSLAANATDNVAVTSAWYTIDGGAPVSFTFTSGASVSLSASLGSMTTGVYEICVTAQDAASNTSNTECTMLAVYDPNAGFVTGGGWFVSPAGAYAADPALTGKATFGFVSKYVKGKTLPTGNTEFQFHAGSLNFSSTAYEWLVVNQAGMNAQFKGTGALNGVPGYKFMVWAKDGAPDTFRIQITDSGGSTVYDNFQDGTFGTPLGGGNIMIQIPKK